MQESDTYRRYRLFGMDVVSPLQLPAPPAYEKDDDTQVFVSPNPVPTHLEDAIVDNEFYEIETERWLIKAEPMAGARFLVSHGRSVSIERLEERNEAQEVVLRQVLLGSCMGALQIQRGRLPLHGNTVADQQGAILLAGTIGAGKSTLTLALLRRGYRLLADDLSTLALEVPMPKVQPGLPHLKLWRDTCDYFAIDWSGLPRVHPDLDKFLLPISNALTEPRPLRAVVLLLRTDIRRPRLERLIGMEKLRELQAHLYKVTLSEGQRIWPWLFPALGEVARTVPVYLLRRPKGGVHVDLLARMIQEQVE